MSSRQLLPERAWVLGSGWAALEEEAAGAVQGAMLPWILPTTSRRPVRGQARALLLLRAPATGRSSTLAASCARSSGVPSATTVGIQWLQQPSIALTSHVAENPPALCRQYLAVGTRTTLKCDPLRLRRPLFSFALCSLCSCQAAKAVFGPRNASDLGLRRSEHQVRRSGILPLCLWLIPALTARCPGSRWGLCTTAASPWPCNGERSLCGQCATQSWNRC